jgi:sulfofructose kinase
MRWSATAGAPHIVGIGAATLDDLWLVKEFMPVEGVDMALARTQMGGGPVATSLCVLSQLGQKTTLFDSCGDDHPGRQILASLDRFGVQTTEIEVIPGATSAMAVIRVRQLDGARQITFLPSTATEPTLNAQHAAKIREARLLHLNGRHETLARACVEIAQRSNTLISFDGGAGRYRESIRDLMQASHVRLLSRDFAKQFTGLTDIHDMMEQMLTGVAEVVVITDGMKGSYCQRRGGAFHHQPAYPASRTMDTTGCGDVFHGAFLHGYLSGWAVERCADFASRLASKNASGLGGRSVLESGQDLFAP